MHKKGLFWPDLQFWVKIIIVMYNCGTNLKLDLSEYSVRKHTNYAHHAIFVFLQSYASQTYSYLQTDDWTKLNSAVVNSLQIIMQNQSISAQQYAKLKHHCIYAIKWRCWRFATLFLQHRIFSHVYVQLRSSFTSFEKNYLKVKKSLLKS